MKKNATSGEGISELRHGLNLTQEEFADLLHVSQGTISAWERDDKDRAPSADAYFQLANEASNGEDVLFFLKLARLKPQAILSAATKIQEERNTPPKTGEISRVSRSRMTAKGLEETGPLLPLPAEFAPNDGSINAFVLDEKAASFPFAAGDVVAVETPHARGRDLVLAPFFGMAVLMKSRTGGLFVGKLGFQKSRVEPLAWYVRLEPFDERSKGDALTVGQWEAQSQVLTRKHPSAKTPGGVVKWEAEVFAPEEIRLHKDWEMLGPIVAWFRKPTAKSDV